MPINPDLLAVVQRSSGQLPPDAQFAVANGTQTMQDAIDQSQSIAGYGDATTQVNRLKSLDPDQQRNSWKSASTPQQQLWVAAGYTPPEPSNRSWFSRGLHDVLGAPSGLVNEATKIPIAGPGIRDVKNVAGRVGGDVLNAMGSGIRATQHLYRTGEYENDTAAQGLNPVAHNPVANIFTGLLGYTMGPGDWADAWDKTKSGEKTFDPNKDRDIQHSSGFDPQTIELAKATAAGDSYLVKYFASLKKQGMSDNDIVDLESKVNDPAFRKVVGQYKDAKLSFGRSLVPQYMWDHQHALATVLSGTGDALFSFADPYLVLGKVTKAAKIAKYGLKAPEEIGALLDKPAAQGWINDVSGYLAKGDYAGLINRHPQLSPVQDFLKQSDITTPDELKQAMQTKKPSAELLNAQAGEGLAQENLDNLLSRAPQQAGGPVITAGSDLEKQVKQAYEELGLAKVKSADELKQWLTDNTLANHIAVGHGSAVNHGVQMVPTLTAAGKLVLDSKGFLKKAIDVTADHKINVGPDGAIDMAGATQSGPINLLGRTARKMVNLIPDGMSLKPNDVNALTSIQRFANLYLPAGASDALVNRWVNAGNDLSTKRNIYIDMLSNTFKAAGIDESSSIYSHYIGTIGRGLRTQRYSSGGNDAMKMADGLETTAGLLDHHLTDEWSLPSFRDLSAEQSRNMLMSAAYKFTNNGGIDRFVNFWKTSQLLRVGFPLRVSLEELAGTVAREGPVNVAKSWLAGRALKGVGAMEGPLEGVTGKTVLDPVQAGVSRLLRELPQAVQDRVHTPADLQAAVLAHRTDQMLRTLSKKVPGVSEIEETIKRYPELFEKGLTGEISSVHAKHLGYEATNAAQLVEDGVREDRVNFTPHVKTVPSGKFKQYEPGDAGFMAAWMKSLDDIGSSTNTQIILKNLGDNTTTLRNKVADFLQSPEYKDKWNSAARSERLSDGSMVGIDATPREAALDWADHLISHVKTLVTDPNSDGKLHEDIVKDLLKNGKVSSMAVLSKIKRDMRPLQTVGPEYMQLPGGGVEGVLHEFVERGFTRMGRAIDYMSRQPMYVNAVHKADADLRPHVEAMFGEGSNMSKEILSDLVKRRADAETLPFIHNPRIRSQMNILTQSLAPFQFAQEQFWKRWGRTFIQSPEAMREAQLAHHSLGASGITHKDDSGQEIFTYPATGAVQRVLADGLTAMGIPTAVPTANGFTGQLNMVAPGLDRTIGPSFGPAISIPLTLGARHIKELAPINDKVLGLTANEPLWQQMVPTSIARLFNAAIANDSISPAYANAQMKAIQDLYANGHGLDPNANAQERETYMRRVKNFARINMFSRAIFGFSAPAAPQSAIGDTKIAHQLRLLSDGGLNYSQAMQELVRQNPDAYPYTVFMSQGAGSEPLPATKDAMSVLDSNRSFFGSYPDAGGYFLPTKTNNDTFSSAAYQEQLNEEMRIRRSPKEFLDQLMYAQASGTYYDTRNDYQSKVKNLKGSARQSLANNYDTWKAGYLADHPTFADMLTTASAKTKRGRTLENVQRALLDPRVPKNAQTDQMRTLIDTYAYYKNQMSEWAGMTSARASSQRASLTAGFADWANKYVAANVGAYDVYNSLIRADVEGVS